MFDYVNVLQEGLTSVEKDGKFGFIDKTGKSLVITHNKQLIKH